jgi:hypothetical protein
MLLNFEDLNPLNLFLPQSFNIKLYPFDLSNDGKTKYHLLKNMHLNKMKRVW